MKADQLILVLLAIAVIGGGSYFAFQSSPPTTPSTTTGEERDNPNDEATPEPEKALTARGSTEQKVSPRAERVAAARENYEDAAQGISGRVLGADGAPVAGAMVYLMKGQETQDLLKIMHQQANGLVIPPVGTTTTDDYGTFQIGVRRHEPDAKYEIRCTHETHADFIRPGMTLFENKWFDAGDLQLDAGTTVEGHVTVAGTNGLPVPNATVAVKAVGAFPSTHMTPGREDGIQVSTDSTGYFRLNNITPGTVTVSAVAPKFAREYITNRPVAENERNEFLFELSPGLEMGGTVVDPDGNPVPNAKITCAAISSKTQLRVESRSDENGDFEVVGLLPGPYQLDCAATGFVLKQLKPVEAGDMEVTVPLDRQGGAMLRVAGRNGSPVRNFSVTIKRYFADRDTFGNIPGQTMHRVDSSKLKGGYYTYDGLNPDSYVFEIFADSYAKTYSEPFDVVAGDEDPKVDVKMLAGGTLRGTVVDPSSGKAVAGALVRTLPNFLDDGNPFYQMVGGLVPYKVTKSQVKTNRNGEFNLALLAPGTYQVKVEHPDFSTHALKDQEVLDEQVLDIGAIELDRGVLFTGIATVDNQPAAQIKVEISEVQDQPNGTQARTAPGVPVQTTATTPLSFSAVSDETGRFTMPKRVPAGRYQIRAARQTTPNIFMQLGDYGKTQREITIQPGQTEVNERINIPTTK